MFNKTEFAHQIRKALDHLHDIVYLQNLPLARLTSDRRGETLNASARHLRTELLDAIDSVDPGGSVGPRARERRPYAILYGRYVQRMSTAELMEELAISVRQFRRENKRALGAITERLWDHFSEMLLAEECVTEVHPTPVAPPDAGERRAAARVETEQLIQHARTEVLHVPPLVERILSVLRPVAARHGVQLHNGLSAALPAPLPPVQADRVVLRQALMEVLAFGLDCAREGELTIRGRVEPGAATALRIDVIARGKIAPDRLRTGVSMDVSQRLLASMAGNLTITTADGHWHAHATLPLAEAVPIVVMDDNEGLVELFRRYLVDSPCRIHAAHLAEEAIDLVATVHPRLILLDVMMPQQDGWEILQKLRAEPITARTPVVICSVLNEPEIAHALGATDYLPKPVTQSALLAKLARWI